MDKNLEKKALKKIQNIVFKKDEILRKKKNISELRKTNFESLSELTSLSYDEISSIADQVYKEITEDRKKRRKRIRIISSIVCLLIIIAVIIYIVNMNKYSFYDDFTNNINSWKINDIYDYKIYTEDGMYIIDNYKFKGPVWSYLYLEMPQNYVIELTSKWMKGKYSGYGLLLKEKNNNHFLFKLNGEGSTSTAYFVNDSYKIDTKWKKNVTELHDDKSINIQRIEVKNNEYKYFVNNKIIAKSYMPKMKIESVGFWVNVNTKVAFDNLKIFDLDNNEYNLNEDFKDLSNGWIEDHIYNYKYYIKNDMYYIENNISKKCSFSEIPIKIKDGYKVEVKTKWIKGETGNYGFILMEDYNNYVGFEINNNGTCMISKYINNKYTYVDDDTKIISKSESDNINILTVYIEDKKINFSINNKLTKIVDYDEMEFNYIGLRVCDKQIVAFDSVKIEEN